ncbi:Glutamate receptor [Amphibalanus amphitrite]|uniref:Glutamate receptor n=1 Tax=Amphibalanus amphitrite TaxID=1232801 RepID=A0A6A4VQG6_AMPAM|nr:Glutamate receptor [Amphibalanus amphitrite]
MERRGDLVQFGPGWEEDESETALNRTLRVTAFDDPPIVTLERLADGSVRGGGYLFQLWELVADQLQLNYTIVEPRTNGYGMLTANGSWTGVIAELVEGRADVALSLLSITPQREAVVDFLNVPVEMEKLSFVVRLRSDRAPGPSLGMFASLLRPLSGQVWWSLLASLLVLSVVLRATLKLSSPRAEDSVVVRDMGWGSCLLAGAMTVLGQGWDRTPRSLAGRTATIFGWVMGILIYINYTANLMSFLITNTATKPISSVREFLQQPDWHVAIKPGVSQMSALASSEDVYERQLYERIMSGDRLIPILTNNISIQDAFGPKIMTFVNMHFMEHDIGDDACNYAPLQNTPVKATPSYWAAAKGRAALKREVTKVLTSLAEMGIRSKLMAYLPGRTPSICEKAIGGYREISLEDVLSVLLLVPLGIITSLVVLGLEMVTKGNHRALLQKMQNRLH